MSSAIISELDRAIGAHGLWKNRLVEAITTGKVEVPADKAQQDNACDFGKWLYGSSIPSDARTSPHYKNIQALHAAFHKAAARVTTMVTSGKRDEAQKAIAITGDFSVASGRLVAAMMDWKKSLK